MLFNSYEFIFVFLPLALAGFFVLGINRQRQAAVGWLVAASLFFYGWWNPAYLTLIAISILFNFAAGQALSRRPDQPRFADRLLLAIAISANLGALAYFKYTKFFLENLYSFTGSTTEIPDIILPLAISFFTFQQITFIVDSYYKLTREYSFLHYCLFVSFFPQLIAGPIVHHSEMLPQFRRSRFRPGMMNLAVGLTIFSIGLFKKAVLADGIAVYATPVFQAAETGQQLAFFQSWGGALAYTFQLYFDFSGYSDMAIGAARMFGIKLPLNFNSPYKALNIIDFWRRWHMTLSRFLRDYLYIPLGGSRKGNGRRYLNLAATMLLGGLWHGAGWTFVIWGGLHGLYLVVNHLWRAGVSYLFPGGSGTGHPLLCFLSWLATFCAVVAAWVFFRAESFDGAISILRGMVALNGVTVPSGIAHRLPLPLDVLGALGIEFTVGGGTQLVLTYLWVFALSAIALIAPNTQEILRNYKPALGIIGERMETRGLMQRLSWSLSPFWVFATAALLAGGILALPQVSEFLYFQF